jgi:hypothetical protein
MSPIRTPTIGEDMFLGIGRLFADWAYDSATTDKERAAYGAVSSILTAAIVGSEIGVLYDRILRTQDAVTKVVESKTHPEPAVRAA